MLKTITGRTSAIDCTGMTGSVHSYIISNIYDTLKKPIVLIVSDSKAAERLIDDLSFFSANKDLPVIYFPPYNIMPYKFISYHNETAVKRIAALYRMMAGEKAPIVILTAAGIVQKIIPKKRIAGFAELVMAGEEIDPDQLIGKLISGGYTRTVLVEEPGDFAVRGGIIDMFTPLYDDPVRLELFGDMVESIRFFSASSQRTVGEAGEIILLPAREVMIEKTRLDQILSRFRSRAAELELPKSVVRDLISRVKREGVFQGLESLVPLIYEKLDTILDYLPEESTYFCIDPAGLEREAAAIHSKADDNYQTACEEKRFCVPPEDLFVQWKEVSAYLGEKKPVYLKSIPVFRSADDDGRPVLNCGIDVKENVWPVDSGQMESPLLPVVERIRKNNEDGVSTVLSASSDMQAGRLASLLEPYGIAPLKTIGFPGIKRKRGRVYIGCGMVSQGFSWPDESLDLITESLIFGFGKKRKKRPKKRPAAQFLVIEDLKKGDLVVHTDYGVGRYGGLTKLTVGRAVNDFLLMTYKDGDKLYLPVDRMGLIQKYMGVDGIIPVLDKMGGKSWDKAKEKVKKSAEKIAGELLKLYAERKVQKGHAFGDTEGHFKDFEAGFPFEETTDQKQAIEDVIDDMCRSMPMDRLVCGDVGYGKTEVALRASFLAVSEAKQVAVLAPTTVLVEQHYETFSSRFKRYPVEVACLSRFRSAKEQRGIIDGLKKGTIDIVIGTHRLLQKDVAFADLGLFVLDEEQRFGVKQKEKLKRIRRAVDVLALTATPIPRTLHMSLMGVRDISTISTPPEHRRSIVTYISEYDDVVVAEAVTRELDRGGQVFFVHNHIRSIYKMGEKLKALAPEAVVAVAHGQMAEDDLEEVMYRFTCKKIDLLVCTTIIESGIDVSSANTIIINRADRFGLSQIYQLRGRVGRSEEQAYAYLFIPEESVVGKDAQKRLKVLMEHSDLGSGFQIAMSDLKIRGGGTILGASQSGHIAAVGYDMFLKLMESSVAHLKGEPIVDALEPEINLPLSAFISEDFVKDIDQRLSFYRRLSKMKRLSEISDFKSELKDRYGKIPEAAENLLLKIMLKILSKKAGVKRLDLMGRKLHLSFSEQHQTRPFGIVEMISSSPKKYAFTPDHLFKAQLPEGRPRVHLGQVKNILIEISQHVNC